MKVKALQLGYYDLLRRKPGEVFELFEESHFSKRWMEKVSGDAPVARRGRPPKAAIQPKPAESLDVI